MPPLDGMSRDILNDFVTESRELIETTDQNLVSLEQRPSDGELINSIFRAMHTIKGASSFLALTPITELAHSAEDALNSLRKSASSVTADTMDLLLKAVDLLRGQIEQVTSDAPLQTAPPTLIAALRRIGAGQEQRGEARADDANQAGAAEQIQTIAMDDSKRDILPFMVEDMHELLGQLSGLIDGAAGHETGKMAVAVCDLTDQLCRCAAFFDVAQLADETAALRRAGENMANMSVDAGHQILPRMSALIEVLDRRTATLGELHLVPLDTATLMARLTAAINGDSLDADATLRTGADVAEVYKHDRIAAKTATAAVAANRPTVSEPTALAAQPAPAPAAENEPAAAQSSTERTIRVDVDRLEAMLNLVGELVLQKNRVLGISKRMAGGQITHKVAEELVQVGGDLDQITSDLQMSVMKTRMQPLSKLFNRYPRVIRDMARTLSKQIDLRMDGGDTEVDKSVIESLGDPLIHLLRNSADHGVESPEKRTAAGKTPTGVIELAARHEGNHVLVTIRDDGNGLDTERLKSKAVEKGLITAEVAATLSMADTFNLIFLPGFSTAEKVSDVSGRGVGMDVVRTNIARLNGTVEVQSQRGVGTTVSIRIPLTVAIMPAMMVKIGSELYAVPISNIQEIVRPQSSQIYAVASQPVMRLRDSVLPLVNMGRMFDGVTEKASHPPIVVVVALGERRLGLLVDGLIGQEEIVIKPLDERCQRSSAISGATVREDGGVSLIIDITELFKSVEQSERKAA